MDALCKDADYWMTPHHQAAEVVSLCHPSSDQSGACTRCAPAPPPLELVSMWQSRGEHHSTVHTNTTMVY